MLNHNFKYEVSFQDRLNESTRILAKYPDRKPIICEKLPNQFDLPNIDKRKYLVPNDLTIGQFLYVIRKRMRLNQRQPQNERFSWNLRHFWIASSFVNLRCAPLAHPFFYQDLMPRSPQ